MVVKLPFSKNPKTRQLRRRLSQAEADVCRLKQELAQAQSPNINEAVTATPERAAIYILEEVNVSPPRSEAVKALTPYTETMSLTQKAPTKVKKTLFAAKPRNRVHSLSKILSKK